MYDCIQTQKKYMFQKKDDLKDLKVTARRER